MTFWRPVVMRAMRSAFSLASAPPRVKKNVSRLPGVRLLSSSPSRPRTSVANWGAANASACACSAMASAVLVGFSSYLLLPLAQSGAVATAGLVVPLLGLASFVVSVCLPIYFVNTITVRQATVPDHLQGRVVGTIRTVVIACTPIGALLGGALGQYAGLVPTLLTGAAVGMLALAWIAAGPIRLTSVRRSEIASAGT